MAKDKTDSEKENIKKPVEVKPWLPAKWDYDADVVVVGFGGAGSAAAMYAYDTGASTLILEKEATGGGDTGISGGIISWSSDVANLKGLSFMTIDDALAKAVVDASNELPDWLKTLDGLELMWVGPTAAIVTKGGGIGLFASLKRGVEKRGIRVLYNTPGKQLLQDPITGEVLGIKASSQGADVYVKAKKAVILSTGGYEGNQKMINDFNVPGVYFANWGHPGNTGDGINMAMRAGAALWHMALTWEGGRFAYKLPSMSINGISLLVGSYMGGRIVVDRYGNRFMNETKHSVPHTKEAIEAIQYKDANSPERWVPNTKEAMEAIQYKGTKYPNMFVPTCGDYPHIPFFLVFDETVRRASPLYVKSNPPHGYADVHNAYDWSTDNTAEIKKGWIVKGNTPQELATKMTAVHWNGATVRVDPSGLAATIDKFNGYCAAGEDKNFGRDPKTMALIATPPYYAIELCLSTAYTIGGPKHNAVCQTLDTAGQPIPRLYTVGNNGDSNVIFPGGCARAMSDGHIAAKHAVSLASWD